MYSNIGYSENAMEGVVYEKDNYLVFVVDNGYILYNTEKDFKEGHTHLKSLRVAKSIIDNCKFRKKPNTDNMYILSSHIRVSNDDKYISYIASLMSVKGGKTKKLYYNSKGRRLR